jgi:hypothetical protein
MQFQVYVLTDDGGTSEPTDGADQDWQYGAMTWLLGGTAVFGPASATPYAGDYPTANVAWTLQPSLGAPEYQYSVVSTTSFEVIASEVPAATNVYTDHERLLQFPLSLGGSFTDSYASPAHTGTETWTFTGYGTFTTTEGSFTDQIKMKSSNGDLILWNASPIYPRYLASGSNVFLFVASANGISDPGGDGHTPLFPSPCANELTVEKLGPGPWRITDVTGRTVLSGSGDGSAVQHINVSALPSGTYLLKQDGDQLPTRFVKE